MPILFILVLVVATRFLPAAFLGAAFLVATLATAADFDDPGTIPRSCLMLVIELVLASPCAGVACDVVFSIRRLGNSTLVAASIITLELFCRSHGNIKSEQLTSSKQFFAYFSDAVRRQCLLRLSLLLLLLWLSCFRQQILLSWPTPPSL